MENQHITALQTIFKTRLDTLSHLLDVAERHFSNDRDALLQKRIAPDMFPFGTQIVFTCNQPRNFSLWCSDQPANNLNPEVSSWAEARLHISATQELLANIDAIDAKLLEIGKTELGQGLYLEMSGLDYINAFLMPNFYFHLTTAYNILRMEGVTIGKRDFMTHLLPFLKHQNSSE